MSTHFIMIQDAIKRILSIALFVVLARLLDQNTFGHYQQVILVISFMAMMFTGGLPIALSYFFGQNNSAELQRITFQRFFFFQLIAIVVGAVLYLIFSGFISREFKNFYLDSYSTYIVLIFMGVVLPDFLRNSSVLFNSMKSYTLITSSIQIITVSLTILVAIESKNIKSLILITAISSIVLILSLLWLNKNKIYPLANIYRKENNTKGEIKYVIAMSATSLVGVVNSYTDQITASILLSPVDYSLLKVGAFQIPFISIVTGSILTAMIPVVSKLFKQRALIEIEQLWAHSIEKATILLVPIVIFCMVFGKEIIVGFFGSNYSASGLIFQIYMFQWLRAVVVFGGVMGAIGLEKELFKNTVFITILNVMLNIYMISKFGIVGAAITTTAMNYFGGYLLIKKINNVLPNKFFSYFPVKSYFLVLICSLMLALIMKTVIPMSGLIAVMALSALYYFVILSLWIKWKGDKLTLSSYKRLL
ncbi:TPA: oligosaccharide flippase family protein [Citrobacter amalonaticus]|uniref:oligosaccharide flippase family protein n=1 Tax=Citrobacter amalonaticus TaxID=35703 RepID=UPI0038963A37